MGESTGLGLSISHSIVEKHGGDITVANNNGKGATFTVKLLKQKNKQEQINYPNYPPISTKLRTNKAIFLEAENRTGILNIEPSHKLKKEKWTV